MNEDCIFCKIIAGKIPSEIRYQDEDIVAFNDIHPKAPLHLLIVPKKHIPSLADVTGADSSLMGHMVAVACELARKEWVADKGFRLIINSGKGGGQLIPHLHMHLLAGLRLPGRLL